MEKFVLATRRFLRDDDGVTSIEYALIASLIAMAIASSLLLVGPQVGYLYEHVKDCVEIPMTCGS